MVRTQIQLTEEQYEMLRARAAAENRSMADVVRQLVEDSLHGPALPGPDERRRRALGAIGCLGKAGPPDLSRRHDDYLAEAFR